MNLLGFQSQIVTDAYRTMVRATWPSTLKVIVPGGLDAGLLREWRQRRPDGLLVLRHYFPDEDLRPAKYTATLNAADHIADLKPILEVPINEAYQTDPDSIARLADYSAEFVRLAAAQGFTAAVGVFSEGNPGNFTWWPRFFPALRAAREYGGYLALHEYGIPSLGFDDWHLLRHRRVWLHLPEDCRVPILITECGIDGGIEGRREQGWRSYMTAPQYRYWLTNYHLELARDPYVHGATLFLCGGNDQWRQFDITDEHDLRPPLTENLTMPARWTPQEVPMPVLKGLDVSNHQGAVDYGLVKAAGYSFVIAKASGDEGPSNVFFDPWFPRNWAQAAEHQLVRGAYHYARPSVASPAASVTTLESALLRVGGLRPGDLVALDTEDPGVPNGVSLHAWTAEWLDLAERVLGVRAFKYSGRYYTSTHDLEHADLERWPTWWAAYQATKPTAVTGWTPIHVWQNSASGRVPGVGGDCDTNLFDGTREQLLALGKPADPAPAVPAAVVAALDTLWSYVGPDVEAQKHIVAVKELIGLQ